MKTHRDGLPGFSARGFQLGARGVAKENEFIRRLLRITTPLGDVRVRPMFGGYGVFLDGAMFALVSRDDRLFLKADHGNRPEFERRGLKPFGRMPYFAAPPECLEGWAGMERWAVGAVEAARRAKAGKREKNNPKTRLIPRIADKDP